MPGVVLLTQLLQVIVCEVVFQHRPAYVGCTACSNSCPDPAFISQSSESMQMTLPGVVLLTQLLQLLVREVVLQHCTACVGCTACSDICRVSAFMSQSSERLWMPGIVLLT